MIKPALEKNIRIMHDIACESMPYPWPENTFHDCFKEDYIHYLYEINNQIVGFIVALIAADECQIMNICILPSFQHQGIGKQLLKAIIDYTCEQDIKQFLLEVRASNVNAIEFYQCMGFKKIGRRKGYYPADAGREDAIVMALTMCE